MILNGDFGVINFGFVLWRNVRLTFPNCLRWYGGKIGTVQRYSNSVSLDATSPGGAAELEPDRRDASIALLAAAPAGMLLPAIGGGGG